jgi:phage terminase Nu1 subunit (DNA packaging protein)
MAVRKAVKSGRLKDSVGKANGRAFIADPELAKVEWAGGAGKANGSTSAPPEELTLVEASTRVAIQREKKLRLENRRTRGSLLHRAVVQREQFESARAVRDALLNIPDRLASELAAESDATAVHARLDAELRECLESVAELLGADE